MSELTPEQRAWVDALRSGEYEQGQNYLHSGDKFCCLGVACDLAFTAGVIGEPTLGDAGIHTYGFASTKLPERVVEWLGLHDEWGGTTGPDAPDALYALNDAGVPFVDIATAIESGRYFRDPS